MIQRIRCALLHPQISPPFPVFSVDIGQNDTALELRKKIYDANMEGLAFWDISVEKLHLWKPSPPIDTDSDEQLRNIFTSLHNKHTEPWGIEEVPLSKKIVDVFETSERSGTAIQMLVQADLANSYAEQLTFNLPNRESYFKNGFDCHILAMNSISPVPRESPRFLLEYKEFLTRKRLYEDTTYPLLVQRRLYDASPSESFDDFFEKVPVNGVNDDSLRSVTPEECVHYLTALVSETQSRDDIYMNGKAAHILAFIYEVSGRFCNRYGSTHLLYNQPWKFPLIAKLQDTGENMSVVPHSDIELRVGDIPFLIGDVDSTGDRSDEIKLLLHASCIVRFVNRLREDQDRRPTVISAVYFDAGMKARWHKVYQDDPSLQEVTFTTDIFNLSYKADRFKFLHSLYNLFGLAIHWHDSSSFGTFFDEIVHAKTEIESLHLGLLTEDAPEREADDDDDDDRNENELETGSNPINELAILSATQNVFERTTSVGKELADAGYLLSPRLWLGLSPRWKVGPRAHQATHSSEGMTVFLKLLKCDEELHILRHLAQYSLSKNHTITLLRDIQVSIGKVIILPWLMPLRCVLDVLNSDERPRTVASLRGQFLEGVAFLHDHNVAHLDLKPDNVTVSAAQRLSITDFDAAELVTGVETMIEEQRGTTGWMAPEVMANEGAYSPVLADRWSCGKVVEYFAGYLLSPYTDEDEAMMDFANELLNEDPRSRPPLEDGLPSSRPSDVLKRSQSLDSNVPSKRRRLEK